MVLILDEFKNLSMQLEQATLATSKPQTASQTLEETRMTMHPQRDTEHELTRQNDMFDLCGLTNMCFPLPETDIFSWEDSISMNHALSNLAFPSKRTLKAVCMRLIVRQGFVDILLSRHNKWSVLDNLLIQW